MTKLGSVRRRFSLLVIAGCGFFAFGAVGRARNPIQITVSYDKLTRNKQQLEKLTGGKRIIATPKSGYGLHLPTIATWFANLGIDTIALDDVPQALAVRTALDAAGYPKTTLLALKGVFSAEETRQAIRQRITPVISYPINLKHIRALSPAERKRLGVHLFVNTGVNDQGFKPNIAYHLADELGDSLKGVLAHFSNADAGDIETSSRELAEFNAFVRALRAKGIAPEMVHMAKSLAIPLIADTEHTHVRAGKGFWTGLSALGTQDAIMAETYVKALVGGTLAPGEKVGYGGAWTVPPQKTEAQVAILAAGYDRGIPRGIKRVQQRKNGRPLPVIESRMGHTSILTDEGVQEGDPIVVYGTSGQTIAHVAAQTGKTVSEMLSDLRHVAEFITYEKK